MWAFETQLASVAANTVKEEAEVADKLLTDEDLLQKYYAAEMELERLNDQSETVEKLEGEIKQLNFTIEASQAWICLLP